MSEFSFEKDQRQDELNFVIEKSKPPYIGNINISNTKADFNFGNFSFLIKSSPKKEFEINFNKESLNKFWQFLEDLIETKEALLFSLFDKGEEVFILCSPYDKTDIRFSVLDTIELSKKEKEGRILKYTYAECRLDFDFVLNKKNFIRNFYYSFYKMFEDYKNIAFFEQPFINFEFWTKDSKIIKDYLKIKTPD